MTLPVFLLALAWDRWRVGERRWLRDRTLRLGGVALPLTRLVGGVLFIALGVSFVVFRGSSALGGLYTDLGLTDLAEAAQAQLAQSSIPSWPLAIFVLIAILVALRLRAARAVR